MIEQSYANCGQTSLRSGITLRRIATAGGSVVVTGPSKSRRPCESVLRDVAPSNELRKWFHAHPERWELFRRRYLNELTGPEAEKDFKKLYDLAQKKGQLTLLYASKNETNNNATVLKDLLDGMRNPPSGTGPAPVPSMRKRNAAVRRRK